MGMDGGEKGDGVGGSGKDVGGNGKGERVNFPPHCRLVSDASGAEREGWREAVVSAGDHLKRVLDEYGELGFECLLVELDAEAEGGCAECFLAGGERIFRVFVRRTGEEG
ncbi:MAG: hypothetical protein H5T73_06980 [Actinobacteria bacterium]|nr:hypothetical protein [Actinomycetota bacterium]